MEMTSQVLETAADWRRRQADGLSATENDAFSAWIADPENARAFALADRAWNAFDAAEDDQLALLRRRTKGRISNQRRRRALRWVGATAAVLVAGVAGVGAYRLNVAPTVFVASAEAPREVRLDDGSVVILDAGARLNARIRRDARAIELVEGQARFIVAPDPARPFRVDVGAGVVEAVGTVFNIDRSGNGAVVTLVHGAVDVFDDRAAARPTRLVAGQQLKIAAMGAAPSKAAAEVVQAVSTESVTVWRSRMAFDNVRLGEAVARFNLSADRPVKLDGASLEDLRVSGAFGYGDAQGFARAAAALYGLDLVERDDAIVLRSRAG